MNSETEALDCEPACHGSDQEIERIKSSLVEDSIAYKMSELFKALGDPTRIKLIYALAQKELCVHDLTQVLNMGQSAVSHQLRYLRNLRIVKRRKEGKTVFYSLDDNHVEQIFLQTHQHISHQ
ncbi:ArsR/SmtB family transcription factor [Paenibacillus sp. SEL3]|jgi:DNA-binding transcriptional ArsR family regulator|uniref:ArsR family transcriptional regulator n=7 Tax=Paenibacillus TaxID=44249 RepID=E3EAB6_PAEPS|nr:MULTISPECIES: metalloregulator ArsR/SmtB family transcription factor [Paenibacillus]KAF6629237.1 helix-turn-helix transcriptional regulator [Paenibacillus sp. EKM208P]MCF2720518.1 metalloregulator ArsR/SmtB family transcription factor [Paenibacillus sp. UKAQ_18]MCV9951319.1 metalloregulator ArsR/SmtB family transcription factor [Paenibacillus sp. BT-177]ADM71848.1 ArsR family transcriptional regulator [Paenibacillus polymyxa E681]ADO58534.1 ArsR family transcriptional regulator [Paenibacill